MIKIIGEKVWVLSISMFILFYPCGQNSIERFQCSLNHYPKSKEVYKARMFVEFFAFKSTGLTYFVNPNERRFS